MAVSQSLAALRWLQAQAVSSFISSAVSTFDSTAQGNIGPVLGAWPSWVRRGRYFPGAAG